jgi:heat shock protein HslJ
MHEIAVRRRLIVALVVVAVAITACDAASPPGGSNPAPTSLAGTHWAVVAADSLTAPVPDREPTLVFAAATVSGTGGCNGFSGSYAYDPATGAIAFRELSMTAMACLDHPLNNFERAYFEGLTAADHIQGNDLGLFLSGGGHRVVLVPRLSDASG